MQVLVDVITGFEADSSCIIACVLDRKGERPRICVVIVRSTFWLEEAGANFDFYLAKILLLWCRSVVRFFCDHFFLLRRCCIVVVNFPICWLSSNFVSWEGILELFVCPIRIFNSYHFSLRHAIIFVADVCKIAPCHFYFKILAKCHLFAWRRHQTRWSRGQSSAVEESDAVRQWVNRIRLRKKHDIHSKFDCEGVWGLRTCPGSLPRWEVLIVHTSILLCLHSWINGKARGCYLSGVFNVPTVCIRLRPFVPLDWVGGSI